MAIPPRRTLLTEMRLEQAQANALNRSLRASARSVDAQLKKLGTGGHPLTRMQLQAQRVSIKAMLDQDFSNLESALKLGKTAAAQAASAVVSQYENQLLKIVTDESAMSRIARSEAKRAVNNLEASLKRLSGASYKPLSEQVYATKKLASGWVDDIINKGLVSGWSAQQLAKAIVPSINPDVRGGVSYAANRLARTEINNAYHAASWDRFNRSVIVEEVEWLLSSSHPEDDICNDYAQESPFKKNAVPAKPHPNCYCYIVPRLPTDEEFLDKMFAGEYGDEPWAAEVDAVRMTDAAATRTAASVKTSAKEWVGDKKFLDDVLRPGGAAESMIAPDGSDVLLADVWKAQGFSNKPSVVAKVVTDDRTIYRGVKDVGRANADDMVAQFKTGDIPYAGTGFHGNGSYFTDQADTALSYAGESSSHVIKARWKDDANLLEFNSSRDLIKWHDDMAERGLAEARRAAQAGEITQDQLSVLEGVYMDPGRTASLHGIDGYRVNGMNPGEHFWVVQNRSALEVEG